MDMLKISGVSVDYAIPNFRIRALDSVRLDIPLGGYTLGVVGESGSGKTTLGLTMIGLIKPPGKIVAGSVEFEGNNILRMSKSELRNFRWKDISMVYQSAMNALNPVQTISSHIVEVIREHSKTSKGDAKEIARDLLIKVGIPAKRINSYPHELSGGMRQRAVIAMAMALSPKILIADEPTSALDVVVQDQILTLIKEQVTKNNLSLVFITHEISLLWGLVDNVAVMYEGEVVELGPLDRVLDDPLHPYTEMLLNSILTLESTDQVLANPTERRRSYSASSIGCKYTSRCIYGFEKCSTERPVLKEVKKGRWVSCHKY
jgi:peptide/nickel transport system ATP-binding protein